ncbi:MAG: hypothetical protein VX220_04335 [Pseudomonadota bacterium]|nr:hypothetical protein [Pseudomonadota bacterium]MEE3238105.1 hypothetical protein [Pseudomonadota bacterium]
MWSRRGSHQAPIASPSFRLTPQPTGNPEFSAIAFRSSSLSTDAAMIDTPSSRNAARRSSNPASSRQQ